MKKNIHHYSRLAAALVLFFCALTLSPVNSFSADDGISKTSKTHFPQLAGLYISDVIKFSRRPKRGFYKWRFWRGEDFMETVRIDSQIGELWRKTSSGSIRHKKIFHNDKHVIDYETGDLKALHAYPDWQRQMSMVAPEILQKLTKTGETEFLGRAAVKYQGQIKGVDIALIWLTHEQLPGFIRRVYPDRTVSLKLQELYTLKDAPVELTDSSAYRHIDYADVGDMEADPFVQKFLRSASRSGHAGHTH